MAGLCTRCATAIIAAYERNVLGRPLRGGLGGAAQRELTGYQAFLRQERGQMIARSVTEGCRRGVHASADADRPPQYGDEVWIPSEHPDGSWVNGIVNSGYGSRSHPEGRLLVAAPGHAKSSTVAVRLDAYRVQWAWPRDLGRAPNADGRAVLLAELEG